MFHRPTFAVLLLGIWSFGCDSKEPPEIGSDSPIRVKSELSKTDLAQEVSNDPKKSDDKSNRHPDGSKPKVNSSGENDSTVISASEADPFQSYEHVSPPNLKLPLIPLNNDDFEWSYAAYKHTTVNQEKLKDTLARVVSSDTTDKGVMSLVHVHGGRAEVWFEKPDGVYANYDKWIETNDISEIPVAPWLLRAAEAGYEYSYRGGRKNEVFHITTVRSLDYLVTVPAGSFRCIVFDVVYPSIDHRTVPGVSGPPEIKTGERRIFYVAPGVGIIREDRPMQRISFRLTRFSKKLDLKAAVSNMEYVAEPTSTEKKIQAPDLSKPLIPLRLGNQWNYEERLESDGDESVEKYTRSITDTQVVDGETWFKVEELGGLEYWKYRSNGLFATYDDITGKFSKTDIELWLQTTPLKVGTYYELVNPQTKKVYQKTIVRSLDYAVTVPARCFRCVVFEVLYIVPGAKSQLENEHYLWYFAPGIGLVREERLPDISVVNLTGYFFNKVNPSD